MSFVSMESDGGGLDFTCELVRRLLPTLRGFVEDLRAWYPVLERYDTAEPVAILAELEAPLDVAISALATVETACREISTSSPAPWSRPDRYVRKGDPVALLMALDEDLATSTIEVEFIIFGLPGTMPPKAVAALTGFHGAARVARERLDAIDGDGRPGGGDPPPRRPN